jgi:hypothetical protein
VVLHFDYLHKRGSNLQLSEKQNDTMEETGNSAATILKVAVFWDIMPRCVPAFQISESLGSSVHLHQTTQYYVLGESNLQKVILG